MDVDLTGNVRARGTFAPLPDGVRSVHTGDGGRDDAGLDGQGRAYQIAIYDDGRFVLVRRPMSGKSEILDQPDPGDPLSYWLLYSPGFVTAD